MLRLRYTTVILALAMPALAVAGCSDSLSGNDTSFAKVDAGYKNTLDADGKKAVISEMKQEQVAVRKAAGIEPEPTAPTKKSKKTKQAKAEQAKADQVKAEQN
jgi:hypothetical protein